MTSDINNFLLQLQVQKMECEIHEFFLWYEKLHKGPQIFVLKP